MRIRYVFLCLAVLSLAVLAVPLSSAFAAPDPSDRFVKLDLLVWSEYDDPRVLVQYDAELAPGALPREVAFYLPAGAELLATAYADESNGLFNTDPATVSDAGEGWRRVSFETPTTHVHLEYYHDLIRGTTDKTVDFVYRAAMPAERVQVQVQQPLKADMLTTLPAAGLTSTGDDGFKYHILNLPAIAADETLAVTIQYVKTDPNPSIVKGAAPITAPVTPAAATRAPLDSGLVLGLGISAVVLGLAMLGGWSWYTRRQRQLARAPRGRGLAVGAYCVECGRRLRAEDRYCSQCGTKKRG